MPPPVKSIYVDTVEGCQAAVKDMSSRDAVAVDLEGIEMRRDSVCIVQLGDVDVIYLIDIVALGEEAFEQGGLRQFLEDPAIKKLVYDCRYDAVCLAKQHNTILANPRDLQVSFVFKIGNARMRYLPGFRRALEDMEFASESEREAASKVKRQGFDIFSPGGEEVDPMFAYEKWFKRPLDPVLVEYAAMDVRHMMSLYNQWKDVLPDAVLKGFSELRCQAVAQTEEKCDTTRDFPVVGDFRTVFMKGLSYTATRQDIIDSCSQFGNVMWTSADNTAEKGYSFVEFATQQGAMKALRAKMIYIKGRAAFPRNPNFTYGDRTLLSNHNSYRDVMLEHGVLDKEWPEVWRGVDQEIEDHKTAVAERKQQRLQLARMSESEGSWNPNDSSWQNIEPHSSMPSFHGSGGPLSVSETSWQYPDTPNTNQHANALSFTGGRSESGVSLSSGWEMWTQGMGVSGMIPSFDGISPGWNFPMGDWPMGNVEGNTMPYHDPSQQAPYPVVQGNTMPSPPPKPSSSSSSPGKRSSRHRTPKFQNMGGPNVIGGKGRMKGKGTARSSANKSGSLSADAPPFVPSSPSVSPVRPGGINVLSPSPSPQQD